MYLTPKTYTTEYPILIQQSRFIPGIHLGTTAQIGFVRKSRVNINLPKLNVSQSTFIFIDINWPSMNKVHPSPCAIFSSIFYRSASWTLSVTMLYSNSCLSFLICFDVWHLYYSSAKDNEEFKPRHPSPQALPRPLFVTFSTTYYWQVINARSDIFQRSNMTKNSLMRCIHAK